MGTAIAHSLAKRTITWAPSLSIDRNGTVWESHKRFPTTKTLSKHGVKMLAVIIDDREFPVWKLLTHIWYENRLILPRDGNAMNCHADNTIDLKKVSHSMNISDPDEILKIWVTYCSGVPCWQLAEKTGIHVYSRDEFYGLIRDILIAGIR